MSSSRNFTSQLITPCRSASISTLCWILTRMVFGPSIQTTSRHRGCWSSTQRLATLSLTTDREHHLGFCPPRTTSIMQPTDIAIFCKERHGDVAYFGHAIIATLQVDGTSSYNASLTAIGELFAGWVRGYLAKAVTNKWSLEVQRHIVVYDREDVPKSADTHHNASTHRKQPRTARKASYPTTLSLSAALRDTDVEHETEDDDKDGMFCTGRQLGTRKRWELAVIWFVFSAISKFLLHQFTTPRCVFFSAPASIFSLY